MDGSIPPSPYPPTPSQSTQCELDVLVLSLSDAPLMHGETARWPFWAPWLAAPFHALARASSGGRYWVIPEDVHRKTLMRDDALWCPRERGEWEWCGGPPLSFFHAEYFREFELFPTQQVRMHGLTLERPRMPWRLLRRAYGPSCRHIARLDPSPGHRWRRSVELDLRRPANARFKRPASVRMRGPLAWLSSCMSRRN